MDALIFAQTIFYLVISLLGVVFGVLFAIMAYYLVRIAKHIDKISNNLDEASGEVKENVKEIISKLSVLPLFSLFFKNRTGNNKSDKKRSKQNNNE